MTDAVENTALRAKATSSTWDRRSDGSSSSDDSTGKRKRSGSTKKTSIKADVEAPKTNGVGRRRHSVSQAARDPRDEPASKRRAVGTDAPFREESPIVDALGLCRAGKFANKWITWT